VDSTDCDRQGGLVHGEKDAVVANTSAPAVFLAFQLEDIAVKRIVSHRAEGGRSSSAAMRL
jgi:hypothetical protein